MEQRMFLTYRRKLESSSLWVQGQCDETEHQSPIVGGGPGTCKTLKTRSGNDRGFEGFEGSGHLIAVMPIPLD
jgi:hypothetical protein